MKTLQSFCLTAGFLLASAVAATAQVTVVRVEIDYMVGEDHSHEPSQAEIDAVIQMFACQGITLIVDIDQAISHHDVIRCAEPGTGSFFTCGDHTFSFANYAASFRNHGSGWHYAIFGHQYDDGNGVNSSGLAEIQGDEFFVADGVLDGSSSTPFWRAATFAHELGHNLGLRHYAPANSSTSPFSPNLASIMSYQYQLRGVASRLECLGLVGNDHLFKDLDYSSGRLPTLNESALTESLGVHISPVDWNCSGSISGVVSKNLNVTSDWCTQGGGSDFIYDYDEWSALVDVTSDPNVLNLPVEYETCAPVSDMFFGGPGSCPLSAPTLTIEPCEGGEMWFMDPNASWPVPDGSASRPYKYVTTLLGAPQGSVIYLQPGTYTSPLSGSLVLDKAVVLAGPGGAVIDL